jgi:hypothetical protein
MLRHMRTVEESPSSVVLEEDLLGGYGGFGDRVFLIHVGDERYAANNVTLPDSQNINGLAAFPSADDAVTYMGQDMARGIGGDIVQKTFEEARQIAISKPTLQAVLLFVGNRVVDYAFVR